MKPRDLILHCYAEKKDTVWIACCLDYCLAVQGDSLEEVKAKLKQLVGEYLSGVLNGEYPGDANYYLKRKAPLSEWIKYYYIVVILKFTHTQNKVYRLLREILPLEPKKHSM